MPFDPEDHRPETLDQAIELIEQHLDQSERDYIKAEGAAPLHHSAGQALRNAWLWSPKHPMHAFFRDKYGISHGDDMSGMILHGLTAKIRGEAFDPEAKAAYYRKFWTDQGLDPLYLDEG